MTTVTSMQSNIQCFQNDLSMEFSAPFFFSLVYDVLCTKSPMRCQVKWSVFPYANEYVQKLANFLELFVQQQNCLISKMAYSNFNNSFQCRNSVVKMATAILCKPNRKSIMFRLLHFFFRFDFYFYFFASVQKRKLFLVLFWIGHLNGMLSSELINFSSWTEFRLNMLGWKRISIVLLNLVSLFVLDICFRKFRLSYFRIVKVTLTYPLVLSPLIYRWKILLVSSSFFFLWYADICLCATFRRLTHSILWDQKK